MGVVAHEHVQEGNKEAGPLFWIAWVEEAKQWRILSWEHLPCDTKEKFGKFYADGYKHAKGAVAARRESTKYHDGFAPKHEHAVLHVVEEAE